MLNGGYDPTLMVARPRGVDGRRVDRYGLWRFTDDDFKAQNRPTPRAAPACSRSRPPWRMADIGDPAQPRFDGDGFFDTATWGDLGGNLFVARFHEPGELDPTTGRVTNWFAARTFEQQRRSNDPSTPPGRAPSSS